MPCLLGSPGLERMPTAELQDCGAQRGSLFRVTHETGQEACPTNLELDLQPLGHAVEGID